MDQKSFCIHLHRTGTVIPPSTQKDEVPYINIPYWGFDLLGAITCAKLKTAKSSVDDGGNARENDPFRGNYEDNTTRDDG